LNLPGTEIAANLAWKESVKASGEYLVLEMNRNDKVFKAVSRHKSKDRQARQETAQEHWGKQPVPVLLDFLLIQPSPSCPSKFAPHCEGSECRSRPFESQVHFSGVTAATLAELIR